MDVTSDLLISKIGSERIFRFNFNLWRDYKIRMSADGFEFENPLGRRVTDRDIAKFYWRKPARTADLSATALVSERDNYIEEELWYMLREAVNLLWSRGRVVLVEPFADIRCGKLNQARAAARYFNIPPFQCVFGDAKALRPGRRSVVKSLSSTRINKESAFYTTAVEEAELDPQIPWTIQDLVEAEKDVTVAVVRDKVFAFELERKPFANRTLDWREVASDYVTDEWKIHRLPAAIERGVLSLMADLQLHYGRTDLLYANGSYHFLEVNPNGEWGWLDPSGAHGLLGKIIDEISPETALHPLPVPRPPMG